jgi:hypothetical protein
MIKVSYLCTLPKVRPRSSQSRQCIRKFQTEDIKSMCVKDEVVEELNLHTEAFMSRMGEYTETAFW